MLRTQYGYEAFTPVGARSLWPDPKRFARAVLRASGAAFEIYEPFLIQIGFLDRTPRGRVATHLAYQHFGIKRPKTNAPGQETLF